MVDNSQAVDKPNRLQTLTPRERIELHSGVPCERTHDISMLSPPKRNWILMKAREIEDSFRIAFGDEPVTDRERQEGVFTETASVEAVALVDPDSVDAETAIQVAENFEQRFTNIVQEARIDVDDGWKRPTDNAASSSD